MPGYHTPVGHVWADFLLTRRGIIPWRVMFWWIFYWLTGVWYPRGTDSPGYHTQGSKIFELKIRITRQILNQNRKYFNLLVSGPDWLEWWIKLEVENLVGLSLKECLGQRSASVRVSLYRTAGQNSAESASIRYYQTPTYCQHLLQ